MANIVKGKIGNALESVAPDGIVATADAIYDETKGKSQEQINEDTKQSLAEQANNIGYYECDTAAATAAKEITGGSYKLPDAAPYGGTLKVKFTHKNSAANPTLSINLSDPKPLYYNGAIASSTNTWEDGDVLDLYYDGTNFNATSVVEKFATGEKVKNIGIDAEPTAGSENLIKSGGVAKEFSDREGNTRVGDFSISDEDGNAIVVFKGGHIKSKNFDSERNSFTEGNAEKLESIEENAQVNNTATEDIFPSDFAITDDNKNAIVEFRKGHIKTKNFDSENLQIGNNDIDFAITDKSGKAIVIVKDGFPFTKNFDGKKIAKTSELVSDMKPYKTTIVNITDYNNNLMEVFAAISPTDKNHYIIQIPEGTYNVDEWFTPAQIASDSSSFRGVELLNYTKLLGVGCADKIILQWINETYPHRGYISTLNTHEWNELENLTIKAKNIRYAVHDDIWNGLDRHIRVKNCSFIVSGGTSRAWGAGCNGGYDGVFENCKFIMEELTPAPTGRYVEPFVLHDNYYNTRGDSHLTLINCRFVTPYTNYHQPLDHNSWEEVTYDSSYPLYDASKKDYAVNDCVNMLNDTSASYKCLYANTQVMPYGEGRPSINIGFGAEGATQPLHVTMIGCYLSTYMAVTPTLIRVAGFGNKSDKTPTVILWDESNDSYSTIIDLI